MAAPGAPKGNKNAVRGKEWADAVRKAVKQYEADGIKRGDALRKLACALIERALDGDMMALRELGDRLDGKPAQAIVGEIEHNYVMRSPEPVKTADEWAQQHRLQ